MENKDNNQFLKEIKKYKPNPLESTDTLRKIGDFLLVRDMQNFLSTNNRIKSQKGKINFFQEKKKLIVFRFMKKIINIFKKIKHIKHIDDNSKYGD